MARIRISGVWKDIYKKIRVAGLWRDSCWKYRISGLWKEDGCGLNLILPTRVGADNATINLEAFILANNPKNKKTITIVNNSIQPQLISGNLSIYKKVTLINSSGAEFQGNVGGSAGMIITSPMILINNGFIRGAGGHGGTGGQTATQSISVGYWASRGTYDDGGPYVQGQISPSWASAAYFNRFWKTAGGSNSGAWVMSSSASRQEYWNTASAPYWGDQGRCHYNSSGYYCTYKSGQKIALGTNRTIKGGSGGSGGSARVYNSVAISGLAGASGTVSGTSPGFSLSSGINYPVPDLTGYYRGGAGGAGGNWAENGARGSASGSGVIGILGQTGGVAIRGTYYLQNGSILGNLSGAVT